jgi:hypothetical protein
MASRLWRSTICAATLLVAAGTLSAGEKKLMHCFAFTPVAEATQADWDAFYKATDELPSKIPGLNKVWYGKLRRPLSIFSVDQATAKKLTSEPKVTGEATRVVRQYGVCMQFDDEAALKAYDPNPEHKKWDEIYSKVRQYGTTTYDILGQ